MQQRQCNSACKCDLHTHTYFSDGFYGPEHIIQLSKAFGVTAISITDHNCVDGVELARTVAEKQGIELICGAEINCEATELLAYFFEPSYEPLLRILDSNRQSINDIVMQKIYWLMDNGYKLSVDDVLKHTGPTQNLMPTHLAVELVRLGYSKTIFDAFSSIIKKIKINYKPKRASTKKVISEITNAHGVAVLPHPWLLAQDQKDNLEMYLAKLKGRGLSGVETTGPHKKDDEKLIRQVSGFAKEEGLIECGGSDFHSLDILPENKIGDFTVPYACVEELKKRII